MSEHIFDPVRTPANFCRRTRREFLWEAGAGFTGLALTGLLSADKFFGTGAGTEVAAGKYSNPLAPKQAPLPGSS